MVFSSCPAANSLTVLLTLITTRINIQTPEDLGSVSQIKSGDHYDFIIVGAGSAGCVLANRYVISSARDFESYKAYVGIFWLASQPLRKNVSLPTLGGRFSSLQK